MFVAGRNGLRGLTLYLLSGAALAGVAAAQTARTRLSGTVLDPKSLPIAGAQVEAESRRGSLLTAVTKKDGHFSLTLPSKRDYTLHVEANGFAAVTRNLHLVTDEPDLPLRLENISTLNQQIVVNADVSEIDIAAPDPSQKVLVREELLDANPGRPRCAHFHSRPADRDGVGWHQGAAVLRTWGGRRSW